MTGTEPEHEVDSVEPPLAVDGPSLMDPTLGFPGPAEPLPEGDADRDEPTMANDYDDEDDD